MLQLILTYTLLQCARVNDRARFRQLVTLLTSDALLPAILRESSSAFWVDLPVYFTMALRQPSQKPSDEATATHLTFIRDRLYFKILRPPNPVTTTTAAAAATTTTTTSNGSGTNATNILRVHLSFCSLLRHANHGGAEASRLS